MSAQPVSPHPLRATSLAAIILASALAGCAADPDASAPLHDADAPSHVLVEPEPGLFVAENRAIVRGQVRNDAGFAVPGAIVVIAQTSFVQETGTDGRFLFVNVTIGTHVLRAERDTLHPFEETFSTSAGNITTLDVRMLPVEARGPGLQDHVHDFWAGETALTLMDENYDLLQDRGYQCGIVPFLACTTVYWGSSNSTSSGWGSWTLALPDQAPSGRPPIILPGTAEIAIKLTWDPVRVNMDRMAVAYIPADSKTRQFLKPVGPDTTMTIRVNETMADTGHQRFTLWQFWLFTDNKPQNGDKTGVVTGSVRVQMTLKKGDTYLEPPHADYWGNKTQIVLRDKSKAERVPAGTFPFAYRSREFGFGFPLGTLVPPGAQRMRIEMTWSASTGDFAHDLTWRTADQYPAGTRPDEYRRAQPKTDDPGKKVWEFDLDPKWTDAFYQKKSNWHFAVWLKPYPEEGYFVEPRAHDIFFEITVTRDPKYVLE